MSKTKEQSKSIKKVAIIASIGAVVAVLMVVCVWMIIGANKQLAPKEAFAACEGKMPQTIKGDIIRSGDDFDGFYVRIQDSSKYGEWTGCITKKLGVDQEEWTSTIAEREGAQNPTPKELEQAYDDLSEFLNYALISGDDEETAMKRFPESVSKLGYKSLRDLPSNFIQDYIYRKQFFKVYDFDGFSVLANQRPDDYDAEFVVYTDNDDKLPVVANACGALYNISKQSSFKTVNDYTLEISQPFFTLSDGSASIGNMITMFDSFSCAHSLLGVPEWSSEDAWSKFIGDDSNSTKWSKRWDNYRLNLNLQYDGGDYKFTETVTEI